MNRRVANRLLVSLSALAVVAALLVNVSGCETVKGVGKDVQNVGEAGERAISK